MKMSLCESIRPFAISLFGVLVLVLTSCGSGGSGGDGNNNPVLPQTIVASGLLGLWQDAGGCSPDFSSPNQFNTSSLEFRTDSTSSMTVNAYSDSGCTERSFTLLSEGDYSGGDIVSVDNSESIMTLNRTFDSMFLTLHSQILVDEFNARGVTCPATVLVKDVIYDLTPCGDNTINDRPLPVTLYEVFKISDGILSMSEPAYDIDDRPSIPGAFTFVKSIPVVAENIRFKNAELNSNINSKISNNDGAIGVNVSLQKY